MDLNQKIIAVLVGGFLLIALLRVFRTPLRLAARLLVNRILWSASPENVRFVQSALTASLQAWPGAGNRLITMLFML